MAHIQSIGIRINGDEKVRAVLTTEQFLLALADDAKRWTANTDHERVIPANNNAG